MTQADKTKLDHNKSEFRLDINGLRAWAVIAVIFYHFGVPGFGGGFVGVDIFFVISGFLMTGIVVAGLERGDFSILAFYMARARRIVPALLVLCAVLLVLGWWLLPPADYKMLGAHAATSVMFVSNMEYWLEAGYFDVNSADKWLLHTWSLAVEWQFYVLLPLVLPCLWRWKWALRWGSGRSVIAIGLAIGFVLSLGLCVTLTPTKPTGSFFVLPTRAWEMLAGGLVYLLAPSLTGSVRMRWLMEALGLLLALAAVFGFDSAAAWPGWRATVPVLASTLVLCAARPRSAWTCNRAAQWLGTRSYSLYLWHWPLVVALRYLELQRSWLAVATGLLLTALLGHVSYRWVETPARQQFRKHQGRRAALVLASATVLVAASGLAIFLQHGVLGRFTPDVDVTSQEASNRNPRLDKCHTLKGVTSASCMYGGDQPRAIVLGDSHANAVVTGVAAAAPPPDGVMEWTYTACPILRGARRQIDTNNRCSDFVEWVIQELEKIPKDVAVIVVNRHGQYARGKTEEGQMGTPWVYFSRPYEKSEPAFLAEYAKRLTDTACVLAKHHPVYLVRPIPELDVDVPHTARAMVWGQHKAVTLPLADYHQRNGFIWAAQDAARDQCGVKILDPLPYLCWDGVCHGAKDGRPLYYDSNHLSEYGNRLLVPMFAKVFEPAPGSR